MCMNPNTGRAPCKCDSCIRESQDVWSLRNRAMLSNYNNPLVEWTLSEEWTTVHPSATKNSRGTWTTEFDVYWGNVVQGEINVL